MTPPLKIILHTGEQLNIEEFKNIQNITILDLWPKPLNPIDLLLNLKQLQEQGDF